MPIEPWVWPALLGLLGLVFGSFIATLTIRWPAGVPVGKGRSRCDACGKALGAHELVPVLSYAVLRGRCAGCGAAIRPSHVAIELAGLAGLEPALVDRAIGGLAGFGALEAVRQGYRLLRGREGLGGGDPKLFGAIGVWLGWQALPMVLLAACVIGLATVLALRLGGKALTLHDRLPLGVMLAAAAWAWWLAVAILA